MTWASFLAVTEPRRQQGIRGTQGLMAARIVVLLVIGDNNGCGGNLSLNRII
jgi:hypothetical protein